MFCFRLTLLLLASCFAVQSLMGQETAAASNVAVPTLVNFNGVLADRSGQPIRDVAGVTFLLYKEQQGGAPLWMETQNVRPDKSGRYSVVLGSTASHGLPADLFVSGEARWLAIQVAGEPEQPRILLLSVPYALKAGDAATFGGLPPSAYVLAKPAQADSGIVEGITPDAGLQPQVTGTTTVTTAGGTVNQLAKFDANHDITNSSIFDSGTKVGIGIAAPATKLDVNGGATVRGILALPTTGTATSTAGKVSQPLTFTASVFNSSSTTPVSENFRWQAEPVGNNTANASGALSLLWSQGTGTFAETGLKIGHSGVITFAPGQKFPATITGVTAGTGLTGGGTSGNVTLKVDTTKVPLLASDDTFSGNVTVNGGLTAGSVQSSSASFTGGAQYPLTVSSSNQYGQAITIDNSTYGLYSNTSAVAVYGQTAKEYGVWGVSFGSGQYAAGVYGDGSGFGVLAQSSQSQALWAETNATAFSNNAGPDGVHGVSHSSNGSGVAGVNDASGGIGVYGSGTNAGLFNGNVVVNGNLSKSGGSFKIDHPLDPASKYLYHSFVESPDMKNIYDGVATLDASGEAVVSLPEWFNALNRDFRYQLTCIGGFAPVYVAEEVAHNQFKIGGGRAGMKVSWQVTGIRQDAWANAHRIPVEEAKPADERGKYLHPELFGAPESQAVGWGKYRFPPSPPLKHPAHRVLPNRPLPSSAPKPTQEAAATR
jgi:hypothetical protein